MISFNDKLKVFNTDLKGKFCIEIEFKIKDNYKYNDCWMGKLPDKKTKNDVLWFGLLSDGTAGYYYLTFKDMYSAPVFDGNSLYELWERVSINSIDGCDPEDRIGDYL